MSRMKVKDMTRRQQRAVFANMPDAIRSQKNESPKDYKNRMDYYKSEVEKDSGQKASDRHKELMKTTTQTEYRVHQQGSIQGHYVIAKNSEMAKKIVAEQQGYLNKGLLVARPWKYWKGGTSISAAQKKADDRNTRQRLAAGRGEDRDTIGTHTGKRRYGVYWSGERVGSHDTREKAQADIKERLKRLSASPSDYEIALESDSGKFIKTLKPNKAERKAYVWHLAQRAGAKEGERKGIEAIVGRPVKSKQSYTVDVMIPAVGTKKSEVIKSRFKTKSEAAAFRKEKRQLGFRAGKVRKAAKDSDKDGVPDKVDCQPKNPKKHIFGAFALGVAASAVGSRLAKRKEKEVVTHRDKYYKDAYKSEKEAESTANYLAKQGKKDIYIFQDGDGDWNIKYNEPYDK